MHKRYICLNECRQKYCRLPRSMNKKNRYQNYQLERRTPKHDILFISNHSKVYQVKEAVYETFNMVLNDEAYFANPSLFHFTKTLNIPNL